MPIVQVRSNLEGQWLTAPLSPTPDQLAVVTEWRKPTYQSELLVYPGGYVGDVTPEGWRTASSFLLSVDDGGEQAEMIAIGKLPDQRTFDELIAELTAEQMRALGSTAVVSEASKTAYISTVVPGNRLAIGGLVLHTDAEELSLLRAWFPETEIEIPGTSYNR